MDVAGILTLSIAAFALLATVIGTAVGLRSAMLGAIGQLEAKTDSRFDRSDARFDRLEAKVDGLEHELTEFRLEVKEEFAKVHVSLARHDERIAAVEGQRPRLITG